MMIPGCEIYEAFRTHLGLNDGIDSMDVYTAWALWKAAYKAGFDAATKEPEPPCAP